MKTKIETLFSNLERGYPMSLMELFTGYRCDPSNNIAKVKSDIESTIIVTCYTPNGSQVEVEAKDAEHAAWLLKMNPPPQGTHP